jgi:hypothetical protein
MKTQHIVTPAPAAPRRFAHHDKSKSGETTSWQRVLLSMVLAAALESAGRQQGKRLPSPQNHLFPGLYCVLAVRNHRHYPSHTHRQRFRWSELAV